MLGIDMHHRRVGPAGRAFLRNGRGDRLLGSLKQVDLIGPGAGSNDAFILEVVSLHRCIVPVAADERALALQEFDGSGILLFIELVGVLDAEFRLAGLQEKRRIGDVDRAVIGLHATLVGLAVGKRHFLEDDLPAFRRLIAEGLRIVHQHIRPPLIGRAVMLAVDRVPRCILQALVDIRPVLDEAGVDRLHLLAGNETERGVARGGDEVEAALVHQRHHFVGRRGGLHIDLAAGFLFEAGDPVVSLVAFAAFDIAGPGDDVHFAFALADFLHLRRKGRQGGAENEGQSSRDVQNGLHEVPLCGECPDISVMR